MVSVTRILTIVAVIIILYLIWVYYFSKSDKTLFKMHNAQYQMVIPGSRLPHGNNSSDYTFSIWFAIGNWNYRFGEKKIIFSRMDDVGNFAPSVSLGGTENTIDVTLAVYSGTGSGSTQYTCSLDNVPLQKWTNLIITLNNRALDLYLDGKLVRTCVLPGVPKIGSSSDVYVTPKGADGQAGFSGEVASFRYIANAINPRKAYEIYKEGYSGNLFGNLLNKYRLKMSFLKDNSEVTSFEI